MVLINNLLSAFQIFRKLCMNVFSVVCFWIILYTIDLFLDYVSPSVCYFFPKELTLDRLLDQRSISNWWKPEARYSVVKYSHFPSWSRSKIFGSGYFSSITTLHCVFPEGSNFFDNTHTGEDQADVVGWMIIYFNISIIWALTSSLWMSKSIKFNEYGLVILGIYLMFNFIGES